MLGLWKDSWDSQRWTLILESYNILNFWENVLNVGRRVVASSQVQALLM
jgi:hypothetical protein